MSGSASAVLLREERLLYAVEAVGVRVPVRGRGVKVLRRDPEVRFPVGPANRTPSLGREGDHPRGLAAAGRHSVGGSSSEGCSGRVEPLAEIEMVGIDREKPATPAPALPFPLEPECSP